MTSAEAVWSAMEASDEHGGSRRIDVSYPHDAFCSLDNFARRGLTLIVPEAPESLPLFDAMDIMVSKRSDERAGLTITLVSSSLKAAFTSLCDGLLAACEATPSDELARTAVGYLVHANTLLEYGDPQILGVAALRGLLGELIVLNDLLKLRSATDTVAAWLGPLRAPQDFVFADRLIETKTKTPVSNKITISSIDQLDPVAPLPLTLAVVTISALQEDLVEGISPQDLVDGIRTQLDADPVSQAEFNRRLRAANYFPRPYYERMKFRLVSLRYYKVEGAFPRLRQSDLDTGILSAAYDLDLNICAPFETLLESEWS